MAQDPYAADEPLFTEHRYYRVPEGERAEEHYDPETGEELERELERLDHSDEEEA